MACLSKLSGRWLNGSIVTLEDIIMKNGIAILTATLFTLLAAPSAMANLIHQQPADIEPLSIQTGKALDEDNLVNVEWTDLMPTPDPDIVEGYRSGEIDLKETLKYLNQLANTPVENLDGTYARVPGYLVPLNLDKNQKATELLLVPTLGACIHVPPPPPNQTIYITFDKGIKTAEAGYTLYWVTGKLTVEKNTSEYTDTLYSIEVDTVDEYL